MRRAGPLDFLPAERWAPGAVPGAARLPSWVGRRRLSRPLQNTAALQAQHPGCTLVLETYATLECGELLEVPWSASLELGRLRR